MHAPFAPLLRSTVGFDRIDRLFEAAARGAETNGFPPYNIEKFGDHDYRVSLAVAGYTPDDLEITVKENTLCVTGKAQPVDEDDNTVFLHRGIARRAFERRFELAETIKVTAATLENGLLTIDLVNEIPEAKKPRQIEINTGTDRIDAKAA